MAAKNASPNGGQEQIKMSTIRTLTTDSSSISSVAYAPRSQTLDVHFTNGAAYRYFDVPPTTYDEMLAAPSKGRYFHRAVRPVFAYQRITLG